MKIYNYEENRTHKILNILGIKVKMKHSTKKLKAFEREDKENSNPKNFPIRLTDKEKSMLIENLKKSKQYLEFGSGGSTFLAVLNSDCNIISIESDLNWINYIKEWKILSTAAGENTYESFKTSAPPPENADISTVSEYNQNKRLDLRYINIGEVGEWGVPVNENNKNDWYKYSSEVFNIEAARKSDFVFIDGRFRVACALTTILNTDKNVIIAMHDFWDREQYHILLKYLDVIEGIDTLAVFRKRENINYNEIKNLYEEYKNICD